MRETNSSGRLVVDVDPQSIPIQGWIREPSASRRRFVGWLELTSALEAVRRGCKPADTQSFFEAKGVGREET
jgi:hypothetical protein